MTAEVHTEEEPTGEAGEGKPLDKDYPLENLDDKEEEEEEEDNEEEDLLDPD